MSHNAKAKAKGISATSFFELKAELSKQEDEFNKSKAAGKATAIVGGVKRPDKKPTVWARANKGVKSRAQRDIELEAVSQPTLESARTALERKAKIYEKLKKGKSGGLTDAQYDSLLVDFDSQPVSEFFQPDSEDEDESRTVPKPIDDNDPITEYEDEFGRMRTAPLSEIPRHLLPKTKDEIDEDEDIIIRNPVNHFPIYEPSAERMAEIEKAYAEANNPLDAHYDAAREVRAKGAAFYQFSGDEETRRAQMDELKAAREETERARKDIGAVDVKPGEVEGMQSRENEGSSKSRALEKRKRELEERRKVLDEKRKKLKLPPSSEAKPTPPPPPPPSTSDPFAQLEARSSSKPKHPRGVEAPSSSTPDADAFLAMLEKDLSHPT